MQRHLEITLPSRLLPAAAPGRAANSFTVIVSAVTAAGTVALCQTRIIRQAARLRLFGSTVCLCKHNHFGGKSTVLRHRAETEEKDTTVKKNCQKVTVHGSQEAKSAYSEGVETVNTSEDLNPLL